MDDVTNPQYWRDRLAKCGGDLHRAMFEGSHDQLSEINAKHRTQLASFIHPNTSILDVGCGYGRALTLFPSSWCGAYLGIDISPEFIQIARITNPSRRFSVCDARTVTWEELGCPPKFDIALVIWTVDMLVREASRDVWIDVLRNISQFAHTVRIVE